MKSVHSGILRRTVNTNTMKSIFLLCSFLLGISVAERPETCPDVCESCAEINPSDCISEELVPDSCGCCMVCAAVSDEPCGGEFWSVGKCARDYMCLGNDASVAEVNITIGESGSCKCRDTDPRVCGDDAVLYTSTCALKEASRQSTMAGGVPINIPEDGGRCKYAPVINTPPKTKEAYKGQQVHLSCEVEGSPIPDITWYRDGKKMPGPHNNVVVQIRGGPKKFHETSWIMIEPKERDSGTYMCHATNEHGETSAEVQLVVQPRPDVSDQQQTPLN